MIKKIAKQLAPIWVKNYVGDLIYRIRISFDNKRLIRNDIKLFDSFRNVSTSDSSMKKIILCYHVLEKGLTMPNRKYGFGMDVMRTLITEIDNHIAKYGNDNEHINVAIGVIAEYMNIHKQQISTNCLDKDYENLICDFLQKHNNVVATKQISITADELFTHSHSAFDLFSSSRHSVRNFNGSISTDTVLKAIKLAQNAPSACNRQSIRVKIIENKEIIKKVFAIQRGNRGFGHLADKLIVLTTDMSYWDVITRHGGYIDGGIYAMNLLYALHFYHIGACPLNACFTIKEEEVVRNIIGLSRTEKFVLFIAVGKVENNLMVNKSYRTRSENITTFIK